MKTSFLDRLRIILGDRNITRWGKSIGLNSGTTGRINQGHVPGQEILLHIGKMENASISWLVDAQGEPFLLHRCNSDQECAAYLRLLLDEPSWRMDLLTNGHGAALLCSQPGQVKFKGKWVDYTVMELITGPIGSATLALFNTWSERYISHLSADEMLAITSGERGSYQLGNIMATAEFCPVMQVEEDNRVAEPGTQYDTAVVDKYNQLTPHNQESVRLIIDRLLESQAD